jgi:hypothetical protein
MERELSFVSEQGMSRVCTLSDNADDILATILKPYNGKPVLLDLWERGQQIAQKARKGEENCKLSA